jgi:hypothetical protein
VSGGVGRRQHDLVELFDLGAQLGQVTPVDHPGQRVATSSQRPEPLLAVPALLFGLVPEFHDPVEILGRYHRVRRCRRQWVLGGTADTARCSGYERGGHLGRDAGQSSGDEQLVLAYERAARGRQLRPLGVSGNDLRVELGGLLGGGEAAAGVREPVLRRLQRHHRCLENGQLLLQCCYLCRRVREGSSELGHERLSCVGLLLCQHELGTPRGQLGLELGQVSQAGQRRGGLHRRLRRGRCTVTVTHRPGQVRDELDEPVVRLLVRVLALAEHRKQGAYRLGAAHRGQV